MCERDSRLAICVCTHWLPASAEKTTPENNKSQRAAAADSVRYLLLLEITEANHVQAISHQRSRNVSTAQVLVTSEVTRARRAASEDEEPLSASNHNLRLLLINVTK